MSKESSFEAGIKVRIGLYPFVVCFVARDEIDGCDGKTMHNERTIKIRNDLDDIATEIVLRHEIVHAILGTQGRCFQKKFDLEDVCEFVAYKFPEIQQIVECVMKEFEKKYE